MILVDFSGTLMANLFVLSKQMKSEEFNDSFFRKMAINSLLSYKKKFGEKYGELIVACDGKNSWRKQYLSSYKHRRKAKRNDDLPWKQIYDSIDLIIMELSSNFPYRVIRVDNAEADDVIGTLIHSCQIPHENDIILSTDKDMVQLLDFSDVKIYNPRSNMMVTYNDPKEYLIEHIIKGDHVDDVPNILSPSDSFELGLRQKTLTKKRLVQLIDDVKTGKFFEWEEGLQSRYRENEMLIDLSLIPESVQMSVIDIYFSQSGKTRKNLFQYFMKNKLTEEMKEIQYY